MSLTQDIYFNATPDHLKPKRAKCMAASNRALKGSLRDTSGVYAKGEDAAHFFKRKVLPAIEAARKAGHVVRFMNGGWLINGNPLEV